MANDDRNSLTEKVVSGSAQRESVVPPRDQSQIVIDALIVLVWPLVVSVWLVVLDGQLRYGMSHLLEGFSLLGGLLASFLMLRVALHALPVKPSPGIIAQVGVAAGVGLAAVLVMGVFDLKTSLGADWGSSKGLWPSVSILHALMFSWCVTVFSLKLGLRLPFTMCLRVGFPVGVAFLFGAFGLGIVTEVATRMIAQAVYAGG